MPILTKGKLHLEVFLDDFLGENPKGAQQAAEKLGPILNIPFPNESKPKIVMTDKSKSFYQIWDSKITPEDKAGLQRVGMKPFMGDDASRQPSTLQDLMLHETAIAWVRKKMGTSTPPQPWLETKKQFKDRMLEACRQINEEYDVDGLCKELPNRLATFKNREGDTLKK